MSYLGYGSPEKLEKAIIQEEDKDFVVYAEGLLYLSVCSSLPQQEVEARMRRRPSGTKNGWGLADEPFRSGEPNPCPCDMKPETHKHYLFVC